MTRLRRWQSNDGDGKTSISFFSLSLPNFFKYFVHDFYSEWSFIKISRSNRRKNWKIQSIIIRQSVVGLFHKFELERDFYEFMNRLILTCKELSSTGSCAHKRDESC